MPIEFVIIPEQKLLRARMDETCDAAEFGDYLVRRNADPRFDYTFKRLMDGSRLVNLPTSSGMRAIVDYLQHGNPERVPIAFVVPHDLAYGMFRMLEILSELAGYEHRAFRTMAEAEAWLGIL